MGCLTGTEFHFCKTKRAMEINGGDGCTICLYVIPLNCMLRKLKW